MTEAKISVVIPTYNRPALLCELLEMMARQNGPPFEIIIVNDCGNPVDFVRSLYPELAVRIIDLETNRKHVHARNRGVQAARGEWIMLCDDDDLILEGHMRQMAAALEETGADLVYSDAEILAYTMSGPTRMPDSRFLFAYEHDPREMRKFSTFISSGCLYRKKIHDQIGYFDPDMYHYWDWDFFLRVAERCSTAKVPVASVLYSYSVQGDNLSSDPGRMRSYLDKLCAKHGLGTLPSRNFLQLLDEPEVVKRRAPSRKVWDGKPVISRYAQH